MDIFLLATSTGTRGRFYNKFYWISMQGFARIILYGNFVKFKRLKFVINLGSVVKLESFLTIKF